MNGASGYIKLHRKITSWEWYDDPAVFRVFIHLLLHANYEDRKWHGIEIRRGEYLTSRAKLAAETKLSEQTIRRALTCLKSTNEITIRTTKRWSLITVENYTKYQVAGQQANQVNNQVANQQPTKSQPSPNQVPTTTEEVQERKEGKEVIILPPPPNNIISARTHARTHEDRVVEPEGLRGRITKDQMAMLDAKYHRADELVDEVEDYVRKKKIEVRYPARYVIGYAKRVGWATR